MKTGTLSGISPEGPTKLVRVSAGGERQILIVPLQMNLATGTLHAIYRQAARLVPSVDLQRTFFLN